MRNERFRSSTRLCDLAIGASLVALLGLVPGCDFIDDLLGRSDDTPPAVDAAVAAVDAKALTPPPVVPATTDAAVAQPLPPPIPTPDAAAAMAKLPDSALANLPPGFDPSKLPPGFDPSKLPPGFDLSKLPPGVDPANLNSGTAPTTGDAGATAPPTGAVPDITAGLPEGATPEKIDSAALPPAAALLPPDVQAQLGKALAARKSLDAQIKRLNYVIDRNLTKDPADVVRLNRYVRAKRELDSRLRQMAKQYNIPPEALEQAQ
jgi:hypothetical protein